MKLWLLLKNSWPIALRRKLSISAMWNLPRARLTCNSRLEVNDLSQQCASPRINQRQLSFALAAWLLAYSTLVVADFEVGLAAFNDGDYGAAMSLFRPLADAGDTDCEYYIGVMYQQGWGVIADSTVAARWYQRAAIQGNAKAQHNLASLLQSGAGIAKDIEKALQWYLRSANLGSAKSAHRLGLIYYRGQGVSRDYGEALRWWQRALAGGEIDAGYNIGILHRRGLGVQRDLEQAVAIWVSAAEAGSGLAQNAIGSAHLNGEGLDFDPIKAYAWFRAAAESGLSVGAKNAQIALLRVAPERHELAFEQAQTLSVKLR